MSTSTYRAGDPFEFELPDAGANGEVRTATDLAGSRDYVVAVLLRDHYCPRSRQIVQSLADIREEFAGRSAAVVPILPDRRGRATVWQRRYDLPFGLLTDPSEESDGANGFDTFRPFQRLLSALPGAVLFEADGETLRFVRTIRMDGGGDGRAVGPLLEAIGDQARSDVVEPSGPVPGTKSVDDG